MADKIITANREHPEPIKPISEDIYKLNEFVTKRVDSMRIDSTVYKYYVNTPLNELKSKEEKAIKREITRRQMEALNETDYPSTKPVGMKPNLINYVPNYNVNNSTKETLPDEFIIKDGNKVSDHEGGDPDPKPKSDPNKVEEAGLFDSIMEFITSIPETFASFFGEGSTLYKAYSSIVDYIHSLTTKFMGDDISKEDVAGGVKYTFATAAAILGLIAAWKLIKRFVNKDGTVQSTNPANASVAASEAVSQFTIDNESLATLSVCNESTDTPTNTMSAYIKKHADRMLSDLLNDDQFIKYMEKNNPKLLKSLKKYKMEDVVVSENIVNFESIDESHYNILLEDSIGLFGHFMIWLSKATGISMYGVEKDLKLIEKTREEQSTIVDKEKAAEMVKQIEQTASSLSNKVSIVSNKIHEIFNNTTNKVSDSIKNVINHVKGKMETVGDQVESSNVNAAAKMAGYGALLILAFASVWYFYKKYQKKKEVNSKDVMASESNMMYMDKLISIYSILEEKAPIKSTTIDTDKKTPITDKDIKFPTIRGKDNALINNLCNRAKFVSSSLINDKDFVSFAKKANPEVLSYMKAINKVNNKEKEKN